jgi:hypothetical protein
MTNDCVIEPPIFSYPASSEPIVDKVHLPGNVTVELYFNLTTVISEAILKTLLIPEMSDNELIEAAEKTGTFTFWNNSQDDVYNKLL